MILEMTIAAVLASQAAPGKSEQPEPTEAAGYIAPFRLELTIGTRADGSDICAVRVNGESADLGENGCRALDELGGAEFRDNLGRDTDVTVMVAIELDDAPAPARSLADRGDLLVDATAMLSVDADGRVTECRVTETNYHREFAVPGSLDLCSFPGFNGDRVFAPAGDGEAARTGRMRFELYLRTGLARQTI